MKPASRARNYAMDFQKYGIRPKFRGAERPEPPILSPRFASLGFSFPSSRWLKKWATRKKLFKCATEF